MGNKTYKWGIIGCGHIAHKFAESLKTLDRARLYAVASRSVERAAAFAERYQAEQYYNDYEALASNPDIDIVYIATPHSFHKEQTLMCLENRKAVLCEKPIGVNIRETLEMISAAKKNKVFLMEALWTRFLPFTERLYALIEQHAIGELRMVQADFGYDFPFDPESRVYNPGLAGGALLDVGIYPINLSQMIFKDEPTGIQSSAILGPTGTDEQSAYILTYPGNRMAVLYSATGVQTRHDAWIFGSEGYIHLPHFFHAQKIHVKRYDGVEESYEVPYESTGYGYEATEVMTCLDKGLLESPVMPWSDTRQVMQIMDGMRRTWGMKYPAD